MAQSRALVDLTEAEQHARRFAYPEATIDLSQLAHDASRHADLVAWSTLAWWLLGYRRPSPTANGVGPSVVLPQARSAPLRHLARAGLVAASRTTKTQLRYTDGGTFGPADLYSTRKEHQPRLPNVDWDSYDDEDLGERLRVLHDLAAPDYLVPQELRCGLRHLFIAGLLPRSEALSSDAHRKFLRAADGVLAELTDNVKRWSRASRAYAVVSVTRGGGQGNGKAASWNRLHIVVADNGIGIRNALLRNRRSYDALRRESGSDLDDLEEPQLLQRLLFRAFGGRGLPGHKGHGLHKTQTTAADWIGAVDVATVSETGGVTLVGTRGEAESAFEILTRAPRLPGARGTLVHVMLQATDRHALRERAAQDEDLQHTCFEFGEAAEKRRQQLQLVA